MAVKEVDLRYFCQACGRNICNNAESCNLSLCMACKKFYYRYRNRIQDNDTCSCKSSGTNRMCRLCRFRTCESITKMMRDDAGKGATVNQTVDFNKLPCAVCGCSSNGYHFGAISCQGCKNFFRRSMTHNYKLKYRCKVGGVINGLCPAPSNCRKCRLQRCLDAGMSLKKIAISRQTGRRRAEIETAVHKLSVDGCLLDKKIMRRPQRQLKQAAQEQDLPTTSNTEDFSTSSSQITEKTFDHSEMMGDDDSYSDDHSEAFIDKVVKAAARLATISQVRTNLTNEMTNSDAMAQIVSVIETFARCVSEFVTSLPGIEDISLQNRIRLFAQAFFPIVVAQISLTFDVEEQIPNFFSITRNSPSWEVYKKCDAEFHPFVEKLLCEAGNRVINTVVNLKEFSMCCALLLFNPNIPKLENVENVRLVRRRYEMALTDYYLYVDSPEERLGQFYQLVAYLRRSSGLFHDIFTTVANTNRLQNEGILLTPLFEQLFSEIINLSPTPMAAMSQAYLYT